MCFMRRHRRRFQVLSTHYCPCALDPTHTAVSVTVSVTCCCTRSLMTEYRAHPPAEHHTHTHTGERPG